MLNLCFRTPMLGNIARLIQKIKNESEEQKSSKRNNAISTRMYNRIQKIVERNLQEFLKKKAESNLCNVKNGT